MILVTGESLIDMLPHHVGSEPCLRPVPGGSPFNVALALGRLSAPVRYLCRLSEDPFGDLLTRTLKDSGVDLTWCPRTRALSTLGFVDLDPKSGSARYSFYTDNTAGCSLTPADVPSPLPAAVEAVHVGSFAMAIEPFGSAIETLVERELGDRCLSLDPNIRSFLVGNRDRFLLRYLRIAGRADLLRMSLEDLEWLHPRSKPEEVACAYLDAGVRLVVITRGADGASAFSRQHEVSVQAPEVKVVDTVGAGDTFQAALLCWLWERQRLTRAGLASLTKEETQSLLQFASAAASVTCSRAGCNPPTRSDLPGKAA